jgi:hypothetical protein
MIAEMQSNNISPDAMTYAIVVETCAVSGDITNAEAALTQFEEQEDTSLTHHPYTALIVCHSIDFAPAISTVTNFIWTGNVETIEIPSITE